MTADDTTKVILDKNANLIDPKNGQTSAKRALSTCTEFQKVYPMDELIGKYVRNFNEIVKKGQKRSEKAGFVNLQNRLQSITDEQIEQAKECVRKLIKECDDGHDPIDQRWIDEHLDNRRIRHYLAREKKLEENVDMMLASIKFKNETLRGMLDDSCLPQEFVQFGLFCCTGLDRFGSPVLHVAAKNVYPNKTLLQMGEKYLVYFLFRIERLALATSGFWTLSIDCTDASVANLDMETFRLLINILYKYSPAVLSRVIVYNVHWLLRPLIKLVTKLIPASVNKDVIVLTGLDELHDYIEESQLPPFLGGTSEDMKFQVAYERSKSVLELREEQPLVSYEEAVKMLESYKANLAKSNPKRN